MLLLVAVIACTADDGEPTVATSTSTTVRTSTTTSSLLPSRAPDTAGIFRLPQEGEPDAGPYLEVPADGDQYYRHGFLDLSEAVVIGPEGTEIAPTALTTGTPIDVWVQGCHESNPVQCAVVALRVVN